MKTSLDSSAHLGTPSWSSIVRRALGLEPRLGWRGRRGGRIPANTGELGVSGLGKGGRLSAQTKLERWHTYVVGVRLRS